MKSRTEESSRYLVMSGVGEGNRRSTVLVCVITRGARLVVLHLLRGHQSKCLSHACATTKRFNTSQYGLHHKIGWFFWPRGAKTWGSEFSGLLRDECDKRSLPVNSENLTKIRNISCKRKQRQTECKFVFFTRKKSITGIRIGELKWP